MELMPGGTLADVVKHRGPRPYTEAVDTTLQLIAGLRAAEAKGVLHRDIKPANCFVDADGTVKVGDYGLSRPTGDVEPTAMTETGLVLGTPSFAPPEQLKAETVDVRSDIYAVGATLFYLLTGKVPFGGSNPVQVISSVLSEKPGYLTELARAAPPRLRKLILSCMAKDPARRPQTYAELESRLRVFSSAVPQPAPPGLRLLAGVIDNILSRGVGLFLILFLAELAFRIHGESSVPESVVAARGGKPGRALLCLDRGPVLRDPGQGARRPAGHEGLGTAHERRSGNASCRAVLLSGHHRRHLRRGSPVAIESSDRLLVVLDHRRDAAVAAAALPGRTTGERMARTSRPLDPHPGVGAEANGDLASRRLSGAGSPAGIRSAAPRGLPGPGQARGLAASRIAGRPGRGPQPRHLASPLRAGRRRAGRKATALPACPAALDRGRDAGGLGSVRVDRWGRDHGAERSSILGTGARLASLGRGRACCRRNRRITAVRNGTRTAVDHAGWSSQARRGGAARTDATPGDSWKQAQQALLRAASHALAPERQGPQGLPAIPLPLQARELLERLGRGEFRDPADLAAAPELRPRHP